MTFNIDRELAARIAGLELNALAAAGVVPVPPQEELKVAETGTPIYDLNGEILFYRVPVHGKEEGFVDIAAFAGFGDLVLRVSRGFAWNPTAFITSAEAAATKLLPNFKYGEAHFVAFSYPKIAVQFLSKGAEVLMLEIGTYQAVPPAKRTSLEVPPGNFDRWSLITERHPTNLAEAEKKMKDRLAQWEKIAPVKELKKFDPRVIAPVQFRKIFDPHLAIKTETHRVAYSPLSGDHAPCFELRGQQTNVWCVAASVQMLLDFYRYNYPQTRIAADLGLGTLDHPSGLPYADDVKVVTVLESLTRNALDATMDTTPTWDELRNQFKADRPVITFIPGHSRAAAGYTSTQIFAAYLFRGLLVYDPWPPTTGVITEWENYDAMMSISPYRRTFTAQVKVALPVLAPHIPIGVTVPGR